MYRDDLTMRDPLLYTRSSGDYLSSLPSDPLYKVLLRSIVPKDLWPVAHSLRQSPGSAFFCRYIENILPLITVAYVCTRQV